MIDFDSAILAEINKRTGVVTRVLWWLSAKNRTTGLPEYIGLWTGDDHTNFTIDGDVRTYFGAGNMLDTGQLISEAALNIRYLDMNFSALAPEVQTMLRDYDPKFAPVEVHLAFFSPDTNNLVAAPHRVFKGWLNKVSIKTPAKGGQGSASVNAAGHTRLLTKKLPAKRSNENQNLRDPGDTFFNDVAMTGTVTTPWGSKAVAPPANTKTNKYTTFAGGKF